MHTKTMTQACSTPAPCSGGSLRQQLMWRHQPAARLGALLAVAPSLLAGLHQHGWDALHLAALQGCAPAVELLLSRLPHPGKAAAANKLGHTPLHLAASRGRTECVRLLLAAAPQAALARDSQAGWLPLHWAVRGGHLATVHLLLEAAPAAAAALDRLRRSPLHLAIARHRSQPAVARALLAVGPLDAVLTTLQAAGQYMMPLFADLVILRPPLGPSEWRQVPMPCPGLGRALPAALAHSPVQAACLVAHLPEADRLRLRTAALCLARAQRRRRVHLPSHIVEHLLSLFDA